MRIAGRWRIMEAELWDCDALNLVAPAFIEFAEDDRRIMRGMARRIVCTTCTDTTKPCR